MTHEDMYVRTDVYYMSSSSILCAYNFLLSLIWVLLNINRSTVVRYSQGILPSVMIIRAK